MTNYRLFLLTVFGCALLSGCAHLPFIKRQADTSPPPNEALATVVEPGDAEEVLPVEPATADREAALRALPEGTVVIDEKRPNFIFRWWNSIFGKKKPPIPAAVVPLWIGTIKVVNSGERYVLIDSNLTVAIPPGEILNAVGNDFETGTVRTTADRVHPFFIADIASGNPSVGDRVYSPKRNISPQR